MEEENVCIEKLFTCLPFQAIRCKLNGLVFESLTAEDNNNDSDILWSMTHDQNDNTLNLRINTIDKQGIEEQEQKEFHPIEFYYNVDLFSEELPIRLSLNQYMIAMKLAKPNETYLKNHLIPLELSYLIGGEKEQELNESIDNQLIVRRCQSLGLSVNNHISATDLYERCCSCFTSSDSCEVVKQLFSELKVNIQETTGFNSIYIFHLLCCLVHSISSCDYLLDLLSLIDDFIRNYSMLENGQQYQQQLFYYQFLDYLLWLLVSATRTTNITDIMENFQKQIQKNFIALYLSIYRLLLDINQHESYFNYITSSNNKNNYQLTYWILLENLCDYYIKLRESVLDTSLLSFTEQLQSIGRGRYRSTNNTSIMSPSSSQLYQKQHEQDQQAVLELEHLVFLIKMLIKFNSVKQSQSTYNQLFSMKKKLIDRLRLCRRNTMDLKRKTELKTITDHLKLISCGNLLDKQYSKESQTADRNKSFHEVEKSNRETKQFSSEKKSSRHHQDQQESKTVIESEKPVETLQEQMSYGFKPFMNRAGQMIINPMGRSKDFFSRHQNPEIVSPMKMSSVSSPTDATRVLPPILPTTTTEHVPFFRPTFAREEIIPRSCQSILTNTLNQSPELQEQSSTSLSIDNLSTKFKPDKNGAIHGCGRGKRLLSNITSTSSTPDSFPHQLPSSSAAQEDYVENNYSQTTVKQEPIEATNNGVKEIAENAFNENGDKSEQQQETEKDIDTGENFEDANGWRPLPLGDETANTDLDQMVFLPGPKWLSLFKKGSMYEQEERRQNEFRAEHRNRGRYRRNQDGDRGGRGFGRGGRGVRGGYRGNYHHRHPQNGTNETDTPDVIRPNMSLFEPFVGERGPPTVEQQEQRQIERKTAIKWQQSSKYIYLTIGYYNVDASQTQIEFKTNEVYCKTKIKYDRFVRIHLAQSIVAEESNYQIRRNNIFCTLKKAEERLHWDQLYNRSLEPNELFFNVEHYDTDHEESDNEAQKQKSELVYGKWSEMREDIRKKVENDKGVVKEDAVEDDDVLYGVDEDDGKPLSNGVVPNINSDKNDEELTDTSSDCYTTDSDDCYYEDTVPANHIPRGYDDADFDHRFYKTIKSNTVTADQNDK
ncbi:unnamed protein product [Didymodactylos carnosus]|uniref:CS domain-containing protein n=1 Tax=Didymodactylos carnosus TaxID=1234261 RepID=A0A8S2E2T8_9BILA|nr:unnamed protein product [Didymodactylos carnosus]CAF3810800.1 unnamed protein product [Didymodactylos carnosus]